MSGQQGVFKGV